MGNYNNSNGGNYNANYPTGYNNNPTDGNLYQPNYNYNNNVGNSPINNNYQIPPPMGGKSGLQIGDKAPTDVEREKRKKEQYARELGMHLY